MLKSLCAIVHGGDNAVPVKEKGLGEGCKEEIVRKVCKLGRDGVWVLSRMGGGWRRFRRWRVVMGSRWS